MIKDIVTTNWDDFFERECLIDAFVHDSDLAFWDAAPRRLMKIHGSITNFGSIVATTEDYATSFKRLNDGPLNGYDLKLTSFLKRKDLWNASYAMGYRNGMLMLLFANDGDIVSPPLFEFPFDVSARSLKSALRFPRAKMPKHATAQIKKMHRSFPDIGRSLIPDHTPYL